MTLIAWAKKLENWARYIYRRVDRLQATQVVVFLESRFTYSWFWIDARLKYAEKESELYFASPAYAPLAPYAPFSSVQLSYRAEHDEEYHEVASMHVTPSWGASYLYDMSMRIYGLASRLGLPEANKHLLIASSIFIYKSAAPPRLFPQPLL